MSGRVVRAAALVILFAALVYAVMFVMGAPA